MHQDPNSAKPDRFLALTGDLVDSRKLPPDARAALQRALIDQLERVSSDLAADLVRPATLTAGDEVQALLARPMGAVELIRVVTDRLAELDDPGSEIVFGVGWGALSTGLLEGARSVEQLDGPCFHNARHALEQAKKNKAWAVFAGFGAGEDAALSSIFQLMGAIRSDWTSIQRQSIRELRTLGKRSAVAQSRGVSPSVVTESLQAAHFDAVSGGEAAARAVLAGFLSGTGGEAN